MGAEAPTRPPVPVTVDGTTLQYKGPGTLAELKSAWNIVGGGSVTSVGMTVPSFLTVANSPVTTSGTLAITYSGTALPVANGGTGQTSAAAAFGAIKQAASDTATGVVELATDAESIAGTDTARAVTAANVKATLLDRNAGVSVRMYGATGDGSTDDRAAIQSALDSAYGTIYFPEGTYLISTVNPDVSGAGLRIPSNKRLVLAPGATVKRGTNSITGLILNKADGVTSGYAANTNIIIEGGGTVDANGLSFTTNCTAIAFGHASDIVLRDIAIVNVPLFHAVELNAVRYASLARLRIDGVPANEAIQLDAMSSSGVFPWFGPYNSAKCAEVTIADSHFTNCGIAIGNHGVPSADGVRILGNTMTSTTAAAIKPRGWTSVLIEGNRFISCHTVFALDAAGTNTGYRFNRNFISGSTNTDVNLSGVTNSEAIGNEITTVATGFTNVAASVLLAFNRVDGALTMFASPVLLPDGSLSAGGFAWLTDRDTGGYHNADNEWIAHAGGVTNIRFTATGPVLTTPTLGVATATSINGVTISGSSTPTLAVTGTTSVSGANTGDQTSVTGNAGTATALQTARTINGTSFDGTANITVTAAADTLTGTTLNATVTGSSLTTGGVGTLAGTTATQTLTAKTIQLNAALGTDDTLTGDTIAGLNAGATVAQWEAVYLGGSSTWLLADANGSGTYPAVGMGVSSGTNGNPLTVLVRGTVRNDAWNWTPGGAIYLSATAGGLTQTAPSSSGDKVQVVGRALTADIAFFDFNSTYLTIE
jgi:hypothetical protein